MVLPLYLAQTSLEMAGNFLPERSAYMACHFSPGGRGLSNLPQQLPPGCMLILDDSTPMGGHDPERILSQLTEAISFHGCESLLLDFQRQEVPGQRELASLLASALPCPVGVSEGYGAELNCPVLLPPLSPDRLLAQHLEPWQGREIWLEAALDGIILSLTEAGCTVEPLLEFPEEGLTDERLHCRYWVETTAHRARFRLWRTETELNALLAEAESLGVTRAVGLWQELGNGLQQWCEQPQNALPDS